MSLDEQLRRTLEPLADRLRDEFARQIDTVVAELAHHASEDRERATTAARSEAWEDGREQGRFEGRQESEDAARQQLEAALAAARAEAQRDAHAPSERLLDAMRAIDSARSLSEILDTLAGCAGREARRAGILVLREGAFRGWRFLGFDPAPDGVAIPIGDGGALTDATQRRTACSGAAPSFAQGSTGERIAVPIAMGSEVVAVLYADQDSHDQPLPKAAIEALARHAARSLEALTAFKAARALTERPAAGRSDEAASPDGDDPEEAARRYARLLVSEIKLYHEPAVVAGRRERDLGRRLEHEIARARGLYDQRVPPAVRQRADYFHDELIRTLANGDASLLQVT